MVATVDKIALAEEQRRGAPRIIVKYISEIGVQALRLIVSPRAEEGDFLHSFSLFIAW